MNLARVHAFLVWSKGEVRVLSYAQQLSDHITCKHYETYIIRCSFSRCIQRAYFQTFLVMKIMRKVECIEKSSVFLLYKKYAFFLMFFLIFLSLKEGLKIF